MSLKPGQGNLPAMSLQNCTDIIIIHREDESDGEGHDEKLVHGHITSISVLRTYRRLGIATKLMLAAEEAMKEAYNGDYVSLHVRVTNRAAIGLYKDVLKFRYISSESLKDNESRKKILCRF